MPLPFGWGILEFSYYQQEIRLGVRVFGFMAIGLGIINILRVHGTRVVKTQSGWGNSLALILGLAAVFVVEGVDFSNSEQRVADWKRVANLGPFAERIYKDSNETPPIPPKPRIKILEEEIVKIRSSAEAGESYLSTQSDDKRIQWAAKVFDREMDEIASSAQMLAKAYELNMGIDEATKAFALAVRKNHSGAKELANVNYEASFAQKGQSFFYQGFYVPLGTAMFSLLGFYIANAAYRSFRVKSLEALVMMLAAVLVILGQIPQSTIYFADFMEAIREWLKVNVTGGDPFPVVREWLMENISTPAFRAITFGSIVAGLAMAVRIWLSLEKSPLAVEDEPAEAA